MPKKTWIGGGLIALLALGMLFFLDFDSPRLGKALLDQVSARTGLHVEADGFRLNLIRGIRLDGVRFATDSPGGHLTVNAAGFLAEHRLPALLRGRVEIERIVVYEPHIELVTPPENAPATSKALPPHRVQASVPGAIGVSGAGADGATGGPVLAVNRIWLHGGTLATRTEGAKAPDVEIRGLDVELRDLALANAPSAFQGLHAEGDLRTGEILVGGLRATEGSGKLRLEGGHFRLADFGLKLPQGRFLLSEFDADLNQDPFAYQLALRVDPLDTNAVLAAGPGGGFGPGVLSFKATGTGSKTHEMEGEGTLSLAAGRLPASPVFTAIETVLGRATLQGSAYQAVTVAFKIEEDRVHMAPFELKTSLLALGISGWADLSGPLDLQVAVRAPRDVVARAHVPMAILNVVDKGGWVTVPLRVRGTPASPQVIPDNEELRVQALEAAQKALQQKIQQQFNQALGKMFGKR